MGSYKDAIIYMRQGFMNALEAVIIWDYVTVCLQLLMDIQQIITKIGS